jgi:hypothetical protein
MPKSDLHYEHHSWEHRSWNSLSKEERWLLNGRLVGLYGHMNDEAAFSSLSIDKQQALLLLIGRFDQLGLWGKVKGVKNVYGEGGVGFAFKASSDFRTCIQLNPNFTSRFATHRNTEAGFLECGRRSAALHLLYVRTDKELWEAHFDLFSPVGSVSSAIMHLLKEKLAKKTPNWLEIKEAIVENDRQQMKRPLSSC